MTTARAHTVRLQRADNARLIEVARSRDLSKEAYLTQLARTAGDNPVPDENDWVTTRIVVDDDVWERLQAIASARGITVSTLIASAA